MTTQTLTAEIVERTISGETDKRLQIAGGHYVRRIAEGSNWTKLRVGMTISTNRDSAWTSPPRLYFGLCSGASAPPGTATPNHFLGCRIQSQNWVYESGVGLGVFQNSSSYVYISKIENGVTSSVTAGASGSTQYIPDVSDRRSFLGMEITKGVSSWTVDWYASYATRAASYPVTTQLFNDMMNQESLLIDLPYNLISRGGTRPIDESTYGALDTVCFSWLGEGASNAFEISDIAVRRLA